MGLATFAAGVAAFLLALSGAARADILPDDWKPGDPVPPRPHQGCASRAGLGEDSGAIALLACAAGIVIAARRTRPGHAPAANVARRSG